MARRYLPWRAVITPKLVAIGAGAVILALLVWYFGYVGFLPRLLSKDQAAAMAERDNYIVELEKRNREAERKIDTALRRAADANRRADTAAMAASEERRKVQAWAAKYAEIKARPRDLVDTPDRAEKSLREMGW